jgi:hypothetical protein
MSVGGFVVWCRLEHSEKCGDSDYDSNENTVNHHGNASPQVA